MREYSFTILGRSVLFKADVEPERVDAARALVEKRYEQLQAHGRHHSRETLLTYLALGLADDLLQTRLETDTMTERMERLLQLLENTADSAKS